MINTIIKTDNTDKKKRQMKDQKRNERQRTRNFFVE